MHAPPITAEALYTDYGAYLRSVALAAHVPEADVEDLVQEIVASVHRSGVTYVPGRAAVETWLYAIARNHIRKYFRRASNRERPEFTPASLADALDRDPSGYPDAETPEDAYFRAEGREILERAFARMLPVQREVLTARLVDGLPWGAIAAFLLVSESTAMRHYDEACRELEAAYGRWAAGRACALPFPLALDAFGDGRADDAGALFNNLRGEGMGASREQADGPGDRGSYVRGISATSAPPRQALQGERYRAPVAAPELMRKLWRSRRTHFLLGGIGAVGGMLLIQHAMAAWDRPPHHGEPPTADVAPSPDRDRGGVFERTPAEPHEAASVGSVPLGPAPASPASSAARPRALAPDDLDRYLLGAAVHAAAEGNRELALARLQEHAERCPKSPRASQREALRALLSKQP